MTHIVIHLPDKSAVRKHSHNSGQGSDLIVDILQLLLGLLSQWLRSQITEAQLAWSTVHHWT